MIPYIKPPLIHIITDYSFIDVLFNIFFFYFLFHSVLLLFSISASSASLIFQVLEEVRHEARSVRSVRCYAFPVRGLYLKFGKLKKKNCSQWKVFTSRPGK